MQNPMSVFKTFLLTAIFMLFINAAVPNDIIQAIKEGNSSLLAKYMNSNIELLVNNVDGIYSKQQAEQILDNFFKKNHPTDFKLVHEGGKDKQKYAIGTLTTKNGSYRVYFLIKYSNEVPLIHQLRFEKDDA